MINKNTPTRATLILLITRECTGCICAEGAHAPPRCQGAKKRERAPLSVSHYSDYSLRLAISNYHHHHHNSSREFHTNSLRGCRRVSGGCTRFTPPPHCFSSEKNERVEMMGAKTMRGGERISLSRIILMD